MTHKEQLKTQALSIQMYMFNIQWTHLYQFTFIKQEKDKQTFNLQENNQKTYFLLSSMKIVGPVS